MELVSANTKNYLFLTLSQYNTDENLVRARVSMRRDEPFWQGGNSFIACESFRITSAPNQGGLYYQILDKDYYIGATQDTSIHPAAPTFVALKSVVVPDGVASAAVPARGTDKLWANSILWTKDGLECNLNLSAPSAGNNQPHPTISEGLRDITMRFGKYFPKITTGARLKFFKDTDPGIFRIVEVTNNPVLWVFGDGVGDSNMFMPFAEFQTPAEYQKISNVANGAASVSFRVYTGPGDDGVVPTPTYDMRTYLTELIGKGMYMEIDRGAAIPDAGGNHYHNTPFVGPFIKVLAPVGLEIDIPDAIAKTGGVWNSPVLWDETLRVGTTVTMYLNGEMKHGKVTKMPQFISSPIGTHYVVDLACKIVNTVFNDNSKNTAANATMLMHCMHSNTPLSSGFSAHLESKILPGAANSVGDFGNITESQTVEIALVDEKSSYTVERGRVPKYLFTPNELFFDFNQGDNVNETLPWTLQTDVNGGFQVRWTGVTDAVYSDFYISKTMCDSLGLLPYMTTITGDNIKPGEEKFSVTCLARDWNATWNAAEPYANHTTVIDSKDLWTLHETLGIHDVRFNPHGATSATGVVTTPYGWHTGEIVWQESSDTYFYVMAVDGPHKTIASQSITSVVKPVLRTDQSGSQYYEYANPPPNGIIGNTQEVSVESWGTFAEINLVIPNIPFQSMLGGESDSRILASLRLPFDYGTDNETSGRVDNTSFSYYGDLLYNSDSSRSYLRITTDQQLFDCDVEARLIRRDGTMEVMQLPYKGQFQVKLRLLQTQ